MARQPSNLISNIQSGESNGTFALCAIIGDTKSGKVFFCIVNCDSLKKDYLRVGIGPRQGPTAWPPEGRAGKVAAGWQRGRDPPSPAKAGLKGVHRQDCRRHSAHHLPLYQDKAVTPTSLKEIFTPICSEPL